MEVESITDRELVSRARNGEPSAIRELVEIHRETVIRIAFRVSNDFHAAEDIAQDSFLRAFEKLDQFSPDRGNFAPRLFQITKNLALNARRRQRPIPFATLPETAALQAEATTYQSHHRDEMQLLDEALDQLGEPFRTAFILAEIEQLQIKTIAEIEGVPDGTIKSRISRAKASLRTTLAELNPNRS